MPDEMQCKWVSVGISPVALGAQSKVMRVQVSIMLLNIGGVH